MTKGLNRRIFAMILQAFRARPYFANVQGQIPEIPLPDTSRLPSVFVFGLPSAMRYSTTSQKDRLFQFAAVGFVRAESDLELVKLDCGDEIEEALENIQSGAEFTAIAVQINVTGMDPGPLALAQIGLGPGVFPPFGAIRFDGVVEYDYTAKM